MNKLILLDGPYGVGKTAVANYICSISNGSYICIDPDEYYNANPEHFFWYGFPIPNNSFIKRVILKEVKKHILKKNIVVPLTLNSQTYKDEWLGLFQGIAYVKHVVLYADKNTLIKRINADVDRSDKEYALDTLDRNMSYYQEDVNLVLRFDTSKNLPEKIAKKIIESI